MNLEDIELQQTTGFVIAKGSVKIGSEMDAAAIDGDAHSRVLISSRQNETAVWPVTQFKRNEYGFCEATLGEIGVAFRSLNLDDMGELSSPREGRRSLTRGGSKAGTLKQRVKRHNVWIEEPGNSIQHYELATEYGTEGLHIEISGQIAAAAGDSGKPFFIDTTVPWATLAVKDIRNSVAYWKYGPQGRPSKLDSVSRSRDPRKLGDLLFAEGLNWPYLKGRILFTPEVSGGSVHEYVSVLFGNDGIRFSEARRLEILDTGFARSTGSQLNMTLAMFDREWLETKFRQRDTISIQLAGDAIGSVRYSTGYAEEPGDPLGWIHQTIKTMSLNMTLGKGGLEIMADGELNNFDPLEFAAHRERRNSRLMPRHAYSLRAAMPWALLVTRGFSFARRAINF
jgi:hypothetical protein